MKILLLNQAFYPDVVSTAQHASDLAAALAEVGHDVTVLASRRAYDSPAVTYAAGERWRGVEIRRIRATGFGKKAKWRRALDFASFLANCLLHLVWTPRQDVVIAMTSPPLVSWLGALFTRLKGGRFVFWVMDLNPDEAIAAGWLRPGAAVTRVLEAMLAFSLKQAWAVVALDRYMAARIESKGVNEGRIAILPPWSHDHAVRYDRVGRVEFRGRNGLAGKFVVMYSGNHSPCHPLTALLEAAARLASRKEICFCFVGGGAGYRQVQEFARNQAAANIVTLPYQPLETLSHSLSAADLHVVVMGDPYVGIVHPCKVYNIRTLGVPYLYIGPRESHVAELSPAYSVRTGDVDGIVRAIEQAAGAGLKAGTASMAGQHSQDVLVSRMIHVIESAAGLEFENSPDARPCGAYTEEDA